MLIKSAYFSCSILGKHNISKQCTLVNCATPFLQIEIRVANALLLFLINLSLPKPLCSSAQAGKETDDWKFKLMLFLVIFWLRTRAASTYHLMHSLAKETVSAWVHVQLEGVREQTHLYSFLWSQLTWEAEMLPSLQQVLAPALPVKSKFLNSYLEQGLRSKRQAVMCRSPEMSWFYMTHVLPSPPHLLSPQVCFKSIFSPLPRLTI